MTITRTEVLTKIESTLKCPYRLNEQMNLQEVNEWDSLGMLLIIALFNQEFKILVQPSIVRELKTVAELIDLIVDGAV